MALGQGQPISEADLESRFAFHPADTQEKRDAHESVRFICRRAAEDLLMLVPPGREASTMVTKLEEAMMFGNAGIARAGGPRESGS